MHPAIDKSFRQSNMDFEIIKLQLDSVFIEYRALIDEKLDVMRRQQQLTLYSFFATAGGISGVIGLIIAGRIDILYTLLVGLSFIFSSTLLAHAAYTKAVWDIARYINYQLSPFANDLINKLSRTQIAQPILWWESFERSKRKSNRFEIIFNSLLGFGELPLIIVPSFGSIVALYFLMFNSTYQWYEYQFILFYFVAVYLLACLSIVFVHGTTLTRDEPGIRTIKS